jgi:hypothetical protein
MNEQYNKFKKSTKANKNKSEKFMSFYKKCKEKNDEKEVNSASESEESVNDIGSFSKKVQLIEKCKDMLPIEVPNDLESVKSDDLKKLDKYVSDQDQSKVILLYIYHFLFSDSKIFKLKNPSFLKWLKFLKLLKLF